MTKDCKQQCDNLACEYGCMRVGSDKALNMYLDYVNNFLTVARFAEYYGMDEHGARELIESVRSGR